MRGSRIRTVRLASSRAGYGRRRPRLGSPPWTYGRRSTRRPWGPEGHRRRTAGLTSLPILAHRQERGAFSPSWTRSAIPAGSGRTRVWHRCSRRGIAGLDRSIRGPWKTGRVRRLGAAFHARAHAVFGLADASGTRRPRAIRRRCRTEMDTASRTWCGKTDACGPGACGHSHMPVSSFAIGHRSDRACPARAR